MIIKIGNMWSVFSQVDLFCITTNSFIKKNGALVMGRGIAQQARDKFPGLDLALGKAITAADKELGVYGLLVSPNWPHKKLAAFQVKRHYKYKADLEIIRESTKMLYHFAKLAGAPTIALNFPGIGNGRLPYDDVLNVISHLPDNVQLWKFAK